MFDASYWRRILPGIVWLTATVLLMTAPARAASVVDLVSERAMQEYGAKMPVEGYFVVQLSEGNITEGEYIQEFWTDPRSGQFIANIVTTSGDIRRVWGASTLTVQIPVPNKRIMPDTIIQVEDLQMIELPWARVSDFAVTQMDEVLGMQVQRVLQPGRPVQTGSITPPIIISRGERVILQLKRGFLQLEAMGKAITDGHVGQEVRVVNLASNKTVSGFAIADGLVEVRN